MRVHSQTCFVSLIVSLMSTIHLRIDKKAIEKAIKAQRAMNGRLFLADTDCKGLRLAINSRTASWTYAYRKRGFDFGGKRFPMRAIPTTQWDTATPKHKMETSADSSLDQGIDRAVPIVMKRQISCWISWIMSNSWQRNTQRFLFS